MKKTFCILAAALFLVIGVVSAWAAPVDKEINYSKKTTLLYPMKYTIKFSLWDAETEGNQVWFEEKLIKLTTSSTIKTNLGDKTPLDPADFSQQLWVQVEKLKADGITYVLIGTRDKLVAAPYTLANGSGFKSSTFTFVDIPADGTTTNLASVTFTAPSAGWVHVTTTGYCNTAPPSNIRFSVEDSPTTFSYILPSTTILMTPSEISQGTFTVSRTYSVSAGTQTKYTNALMWSGASDANCGGTMTIFFSPNGLP